MPKLMPSLFQVGNQQTRKRLNQLKPSTVYVFSVAALNKFGEGVSVDSSNTETRAPQSISPVSPVKSGKVDKLLNVMLKVEALPLNADGKIEVDWHVSMLTYNHLVTAQNFFPHSDGLLQDRRALPGG